ncbi:MAG: hypothetical protein AB8B74_06160 [Crocinitomicaceae bacterium]
MKNIRQWALVPTLLFFSLFIVSSAPGDWELIGEKNINLALESDVLHLGAKEGVFTKLKFKILKQPVFIHHITVVYGNGQEDRKVLKRKFKAGAESPAIDLPGNKRIIKKIKFLYKTNKKAKRKANIIIFGKH